MLNGNIYMKIIIVPFSNVWKKQEILDSADTFSMSIFHVILVKYPSRMIVS